MIAALTVAGNDSSGGAGVQADIKAFAAANVHGCSVVTCVTAQSTEIVRSVYPLSPSAVEDQLAAVLSDIDIRAAKTGMLYSGEIALVVSKLLGEKDFPIVVDPVLIATVGDTLHLEGLIDPLKKELIPIARVFTPNIHEASTLAEIEIGDLEDVKKACEILRSLGPEYVLIKGGHIGEDATDILYDGEGYAELKGYRFEGDAHGSGCVLSALIAAYLARNMNVEESVRKAKKRISLGFQFNYPIGKGARVVNSHYVVDRFSVWKDLSAAVDELVPILPPDSVPEVGINFGYALPLATDLEDVCGIRGRIVRIGERIETAGCPDFGASTHIARIILEAMKFSPLIRSAINLKYEELTLRRCKEAGLSAASFERSKEPEGVSSMEWGTRQAITDSGFVPDVIYDEGAKGKEPMIRMLGENPADILSKLKKIL